MVYRKATKAHHDDDCERWEEADVIDTLAGHGMTTASAVIGGTPAADDQLLPPGLDSHRYRCCGNGVVAPVAEWLGARIADALT
jgi:site-specific DNA-cytosine methylase